MDRHQARQNYQQQMTAQGDHGSAGPPDWNREAWDSFKAQYGYYPFGPQPDGSMIFPPSFVDAPDWVYALMKLRRPPVTTHSGSNLWNG